MSLPFEKELEKVLARAASHPDIHQVLHWAVMPPGKLFRPKLVEALGQDLKVSDQVSLLNLALALELHHAYSLVHDDMPCMDNDDTRRGKATTHKQFGEWRALLAGDTLLALSYSQLEKIAHAEASLIRRFFHWSTGGKGLILGQWIDLALEGVNSPKTLLRMHELKTARLMQVATVGTTLLANRTGVTSVKQALRLGQEIGLAFQLLDDLDDLTGQEISAHEAEVNPFLLAPEFMTEKLTHILHGLQSHLGPLPQTRQFLQSFLRQSAMNLLTHQAMLQVRLPAVHEKLRDLLTSGVFA